MSILLPQREEITESTQKLIAESKTKVGISFYSTIWRWHFYAGIFFAPIIALLAISGSLYLFKPQIEGALYKELYRVEQVGERSYSLSELAARAAVAYPGLQIKALTLPSDASSTVKLTGTFNSKAVSVYLDPYSAKVHGMLFTDEQLMSVVKKLHSQFVVGGTFANRLVELAACWMIILLITGIYMWWPRNKVSVWGTLLPRLRGGKRLFWRDLHAVPAFWLSAVLLLIILGGLPWSSVMGNQIDKLANATHTGSPPYGSTFGPKPSSPLPLTKDVAEDVPWAAESIPVPYSTAARSVPISLEDVQAIAAQRQIPSPYTITMPQGELGVYSLSLSAPNPSRNATLHIDQYTGHVMTDVRFSDYGLTAKLISYGIAFHEGRLFGLANQLIGFAACLGLLLILFSAYAMWRKRKPQGKLGAPAKPRDPKTVRTVALIMLVLGVIMPLVGVSIMFVFLLDKLLLSRVKALQTWFA
ncbi:putative iron-regulated membrane protein [Paenibacillus mucilaginosus]|uniref:PepSY-associated TM helix domain-containing protein n=1 Tax=Paenibacillus mucilaginosus TaxID=61624 RepID=UPI003D1EDCC9